MGKKSATSGNTKEKHTTDRTQTSIGKIARTIFLINLFAIAAIALAYQFYSNYQMQQQKDALASNLALSLSQEIHHYLSAQRLLLKTLEPIAINEGPTEHLPKEIKQQFESEWKHLFPDAINLRLLSPSMTFLDDSSFPPIQYATISMLKRAKSTAQMPPVEIQLVPGGQLVVNLTQPLVKPGTNTVTGFLLLNLSDQFLRSAIKKTYQGFAIELQQDFNDQQEPISLHVTHVKPAIDTKPAIIKLVPDSSLRIAVWTFPDLSTLIAQALFFTATLWIALWLICRYGFNRIRQNLKTDQISLIAFVRELAMGDSPKRPHAALQEIKDTFRSLSKIKYSSAQGAYQPSLPSTDTTYTADSNNETSENNVVLKPIEHDSQSVPESIFKAYDIRGIVDQELTPSVVELIGQALGSESYDRGQQTIILGRDGRLSSPELSEAVSRGIRASGCDVIDIGLVPTPELYFALQILGSNSGVQVTGSHNAKEFNGLKMVIGGETLSEESIQSLRHRIEANDLLSGSGEYREKQIDDVYLDAITEDIRLARPLKVVIDCGNGATGTIAPKLFRAMNCEVVELYTEIDGNFPNHHPDPGIPKNLQSLITKVLDEGADVGLAFDGDGDRLGVIDNLGKIIWPDRQLMLFSTEVLSTNPGAEIIYDVKCSRHIARLVSAHGGKATMWKSGHSLMKHKIRETDAILGGEFSGHLYFNDRWYGFDDALYAAARLLEIASNDPRSTSAIFEQLPESICTPEILIPLPEGEPRLLMDRILMVAEFPDAISNTLDGLRIDYVDGFALIRISNTTSSLALRFEADHNETLTRIIDEVKKEIAKADPSLELNFRY